jgi:hypothetical protein
MVDDGEVLVFVSTRIASEELAANLVKFNFKAAALHGEKTQGERDTIYGDFKKGKVQVCACVCGFIVFCVMKELKYVRVCAASLCLCDERTQVCACVCGFIVFV